MTTADLRAWLEQHFPGWGGISRASRALAIHRTTLDRKLRGELPITERDVRMMHSIEREHNDRIRAQQEAIQ
jgi:hypothetical protein